MCSVTIERVLLLLLRISDRDVFKCREGPARARTRNRQRHTRAHFGLRSIGFARRRGFSGAQAAARPACPPPGMCARVCGCMGVRVRVRMCMVCVGACVW